MITEYGSVLTEKITAGEARKALRKNLKWLWIALLVVGSIGLAAYIFGSTFWEETYGYEPLWAEIVLIVSAVPFAVGLIFTLATRSQKKTDSKTDNIQTTCEFFSDCIIFREFKDGEQIGVMRIEYAKVLRSKQRENFLYFGVTLEVFYPVFIGGLTEVEVNTIKKQLKIPTPENAEIIELKQCELVN